MAEPEAMMPFSLLVIEDDEGLNTLIQKLLRSSGIAVVGALRGSEALGFLGERSFDLLLVDYRLPDMTAEELIRSVKDIQPRQHSW